MAADGESNGGDPDRTWPKVLTNSLVPVVTGLIVAIAAILALSRFRLFVLAIAAAAALPVAVMLLPPVRKWKRWDMAVTVMAAAVTRDINLVDRIYAGDATVTDARCQSPGTKRIWTNLDQIESRYRKLPKFKLIQHVNPVIRVTPDNSRATKAAATAETVAETNPHNPGRRPVITFADEQWTFERRPDRTWVITSYTFDICLAQSGA